MTDDDWTARSKRGRAQRAAARRLLDDTDADEDSRTIPLTPSAGGIALSVAPPALDDADLRE